MMKTPEIRELETQLAAIFRDYFDANRFVDLMTPRLGRSHPVIREANADARRLYREASELIVEIEELRERQRR